MLKHIRNASVLGVAYALASTASVKAESCGCSYVGSYDEQGIVYYILQCEDENMCYYDKEDCMWEFCDFPVWEAWPVCGNATMEIACYS